MQTLTVCTTANAVSGRAQATKILEEAAEVFAARDAVQKAHEQDAGSTIRLHVESKLADEIADLIIAACGLAERWDLDLTAALARKANRNKERGY